MTIIRVFSVLLFFVLFSSSTTWASDSSSSTPFDSFLGQYIAHDRQCLHNGKPIPCDTVGVRLEKTNSTSPFYQLQTVSRYLNNEWTGVSLGMRARSTDFPGRGYDRAVISGQPGVNAYWEHVIAHERGVDLHSRIAFELVRDQVIFTELEEIFGVRARNDRASPAIESYLTRIVLVPGKLPSPRDFF